MSGRKWEVVRAATTGHDTGEVFYRNRETGMSVWEKPDDFVDPEEEELKREMEKLALINRNEPLSVLLRKVDIIRGKNSLMELTEFNALKQNIENSDEELAIIKRLEELFLIAKYCGNPKDWKAAISESSYALPRALYQYWGPNCTHTIRILVLQIMEAFISFDPSIYVYLSGDQWISNGDNNRIVRNVVLGVKHTLETKDIEEFVRHRELISWTTLMYESFIRCVNLGIPDSSLPDDEFVTLLFSMLRSKDEAVFMQISKVLVAINWHITTSTCETKSKEKENIILKLLNEKPENATSFGEFLTYSLNFCQYPYKEQDKFLSALLRMIRCILMHCEGVFVANDMKILIDLCCSQVQDLPPNDNFRIQYLVLLNLLVNHKSWSSSALEYYRRDHLFEILEECVRAKSDDMLPGAIEACITVMDSIALVSNDVT